MWSQYGTEGTPDNSFPSGQGDDSPDVDLLWEKHAQAAYVTNTEDNDDLDADDYVPDTLKSFFKQAQDTLQNSQQSFLESAVIKTVSSGGDESAYYEQVNSPIEDEDDRRLKGEVLNRLQQQQAKMEGLLMQQQAPFMSPDILRTPPPHPVRQDLTYTQARQEAIEDSTDLLQLNMSPREQEEVEINMVEEKGEAWLGSNLTPGEPEYVVEPEYEAHQYEGHSPSYEAPVYEGPEQSHDSPGFGMRGSARTYEQQMRTEVMEPDYPEPIEPARSGAQDSYRTPAPHVFASDGEMPVESLAEPTPSSSRQVFGTPQSEISHLGDVDETAQRRAAEAPMSGFPVQTYSSPISSLNAVPANSSTAFALERSSHSVPVAPLVVGPSTRTSIETDKTLGTSRALAPKAKKTTPSSEASSSSATIPVAVGKRTPVSAQTSNKSVQSAKATPPSKTPGVPITGLRKSPPQSQSSLDRLLRPTAAMSARQATASKASPSVVASTPAAKRMRSTPTSGSSGRSEQQKSIIIKPENKVTSSSQATQLPTERKTPMSSRSNASQGGSTSRLMQATASSAAHMRTCGCTPSPNSSPSRPSLEAPVTVSHLNDSVGSIETNSKTETSSRLFQPTEASQARQQKSIQVNNKNTSDTPKTASKKQPTTQGASRLMQETAASRAKANDHVIQHTSVVSNVESQSRSTVTLQTDQHMDSIKSERKKQASIQGASRLTQETAASRAKASDHVVRQPAVVPHAESQPKHTAPTLQTNQHLDSTKSASNKQPTTQGASRLMQETAASRAKANDHVIQHTSVASNIQSQPRSTVTLQTDQLMGSPKSASKKQASTQGASRLMQETAASRAKATDHYVEHTSVALNVQTQPKYNPPQVQTDQLMGSPKSARKQQASTHGASRLMQETAASRAKASDHVGQHTSVAPDVQSQPRSTPPKLQTDQNMFVEVTGGHVRVLQEQQRQQLLYQYAQNQHQMVQSRSQQHPQMHQVSVVIPEASAAFDVDSQEIADQIMSGRVNYPSLPQQILRVCPTCGRDCHCPPSRTGTPPKGSAVTRSASRDSALYEEHDFAQTADANLGFHEQGHHVMLEVNDAKSVPTSAADDRIASGRLLQGTASRNATTLHSAPTSNKPVERHLRGTAASQARQKVPSTGQGRNVKASAAAPGSAASHFLQPTVSSLAHEGILENNVSVLQHVAQDNELATHERVPIKVARQGEKRKPRSSVAQEAVNIEPQKPFKTLHEEQGFRFAAPTATSQRRLTLPQGQKPRIINESHPQVDKHGNTSVKQAPERYHNAASRPRVTVPHTPKFATTVRYGEKEVKRDQVSEISLAQSTDVLRKGLREQPSNVAVVPSRRTRVTYPQAPNFATTRRYGEKVAVPGRGGSTDLTLAQSDNVLARQLRGSEPPVNTRRTGLTVPVAPKFHPIAKRERPKSTQERELEEMEYHKQHPFKARPVLSSAPQHITAKPVERRVTVPEPFHLKSDQRASLSRPAVPSPDKELDDLEELKKQFHARPMPNFKPKGETVVPSEAKVHKPVTIPQPFVFASDQRIRNSNRNVATSSDDVELRKKFHAKPVPPSTYEAPPKEQPPASPDRKVDLKPPTLVTSQRNEKRSAASEASRRKAEALAQEREMQARMRQRQKHDEAIQKAESECTPKSAASLKPFDLKSSQRHEEYRRQLEEKMRAEEEERRRQMAFHAREFKSPPPPERVRVHKTTEPEPFQLASINRHQAFTEEQRRMQEEEEQERKRKAAFRAKPLPRTTYTYKQVSPRELESASPFSPQLESRGEGALSPHEYNAAAEQIREAESAQRQLMQAPRGTEQQTHVRDYRVLPFGGRN